MAEHFHHHDTTATTTPTNASSGATHPGKIHASKDKFMGGIKETLGTVMHAEGLKEAGREQKREGDAEAFAAGKGKKHYDPALARKGVGIQHKHMGPNPKKLTEGPCAGCKDGTCQIGHDYDAAICHSCTQGHCDAGHVKSAGMPVNRAALHGDHVAHAAPCCSEYGTVGHVHHGHTVPINTTVPTRAVTCTKCSKSSCMGCATDTTGVGLIAPGHNRAYDAAACAECNACRAGTCTDSGHSARDRALMKKQKVKRSAAEKEMRRKQKLEKSHTHHYDNKHGHVDPDFQRERERERIADEKRARALDAEDRHEMAKLEGKLHRCDTAYHSSHTSRGVNTCDRCGERLIL